MIVTAENYYSRDARMHFMTASQFNAFRKCEAAAFAEIVTGRERIETTDMLVGSYVDAYFSGTMELFCNEHPELFKRDGFLKAEFIHADYIVERMKRDELMMHYLRGQKQVILTGEIAGVPILSRLDVLNPDSIVDMKVMKDFSDQWVDGEYLTFVEAWGYDYQGAFYTENEYQRSGQRLPFIIAGATKQKPPDIELIGVDNSRLLYCLDLIRRNIVRYDRIKRREIEPTRCGKCGFCRESKVLTGVVDYLNL
jgi:hypothetical protein